MEEIGPDDANRELHLVRLDELPLGVKATRVDAPVSEADALQGEGKGEAAI